MKSKKESTQIGVMKVNDKGRKVAIGIAAALALIALLYLGGLLGQLFTNYSAWMNSGGMWGEAQIKAPDWNPFTCIAAAFSWNGLKALLLIVGIGGGIVLYFKIQDRLSGVEHDPRGFTKIKTGTYGTAGWMTEKELKSILEVSSPEKARSEEAHV